MIGLKRGTVKLSRHYPNWKNEFKKQSNKLKKIFGNDILGIEHIGSTAILKMPAKPIIDIAVVVPSFKIVKKYIKQLSKEGFELKKETRKDRLFFTKGPEENRTHYLHIGKINSGYIEDMIFFRDYLRKHKKIAVEYMKLKKELAGKYKDTRSIYTKKKHKFIKNILEKL